MYDTNKKQFKIGSLVIHDDISKVRYHTKHGIKYID